MPKSEGTKLFCIGCTLISLFLQQAGALTINVTYDASVSNAANSAQIQSAFNTAVQTIETLYTNPVTINITVYWGNAGPFSNVSLGASQTEATGFFTYAQLTNALRSLRTTAAASNAVASLPPSDPIANNSWYVPYAEARVMGFVSASDSTTDGSIGFATNVFYTFDPTNRVIPGDFDFIAVAIHEITEVMGRTTFGLSGNYIPFDLFRFTNNAARNFSPNGTNIYFSADNGVTALHSYNTNGNGGDIQDWLSTSGMADCCDAFLAPGREAILSYADMTAMNVLGYKLRYSPLHLSATNSAGNIVLTYTNITGTTYAVLATTNLALSITNWNNLGTNVDGVPGHFSFTNTRSNQARFYRLRLN